LACSVRSAARLRTALNVLVLAAVFTSSYFVHRRRRSQPPVDAHASEILFYESVAVLRRCLLVYANRLSTSRQA